MVPQTKLFAVKIYTCTCVHTLQTNQPRTIDEFEINKINVDLRTFGFDNEVLSVDTCAV